MNNASITKSTESAKDQNDPITVATVRTEPRIDSRVIAQHLGLQHQSVRELLVNYVVDFRELGVLQFQAGEITGRGQPEKYVLLNEDQAYLLLAYSRNTARVRKLKVGLVKAFREARQVMGVHQDEYLPTYRSLHDEISRLAGESRNERFVHMNINKAINQTLGVKSGQRHGLSLPSKAMLIVAQIVARNAMTTSLHHKDVYQSVKRALQGLHQALAVARHA